MVAIGDRVYLRDTPSKLGIVTSYSPWQSGQPASWGVAWNDGGNSQVLDNEIVTVGTASYGTIDQLSGSLTDSQQAALITSSSPLILSIQPMPQQTGYEYVGTDPSSNPALSPTSGTGGSNALLDVWKGADAQAGQTAGYNEDSPYGLTTKIAAISPIVLIGAAVVVLLLLKRR